MSYALDAHELTESDYARMAEIGFSREQLDICCATSNGRGTIYLPYYSRLDGLSTTVVCALDTGDFSGKYILASGLSAVPLFGMLQSAASDRVSGTLAIAYDELDALALWEAGVTCAVGIPGFDKELRWVGDCWEFLNGFSGVVLCPGNAPKDAELTKALLLRLSDCDIRVARIPGEHKTAHEFMLRQGMGELRALVAGAEEIPPYGLLNLAKVKPLDVKNIPRVTSGISALDRQIGGFMYGDVTVWTGKRGEGKSTVASQVCADALNAGVNVCAYSGELRADRFAHWFNLQLAGPEYAEVWYDAAADRDSVDIPEHIAGRIRDWYDRRVWMYDNAMKEAGSADSILKTFEQAAKRYNCKVFLLDNLMSVRFGSQPSGLYHAQSEFVGRLVDFANKHNVHVHLIAHPRKTDRSARGQIDNDDVAGAADITNRAANVILLELDQNPDAQADVLLKILKNRWEGRRAVIGLQYEKLSRRVYYGRDGSAKRYGWESGQGQASLFEGVTYVDSALLPF